MLFRTFPLYRIPLLIGVALLQGCHRQVAPLQRVVSQGNEDNRGRRDEDALAAWENTPGVVASLSKTPCFGSCPAFEALVYADGTVIWHGRLNVSRLGEYRAKASANWVQEIFQRAYEIRFFSMPEQFPANGQLLPGLPQTITYLHKVSWSNRIVDNADAPLELQAFELFFQQKLETLKWELVQH